MISEDMLIPIGRLKKPHGYQGELGVDIFFEEISFEDHKTPFFVKIDNIIVPFFVDYIHGGSNGKSFLRFKDVDTDADAAAFSQKDLYTLKSFMSDLLDISEEELQKETPDYCIGFQVIDTETGNLIGTVEDILEGVEYDYLELRKPDIDGTIEIPFIDEFIEEITGPPGNGEGIIKVSLPMGFLEI